MNKTYGEIKSQYQAIEQTVKYIKENTQKISAFFGDWQKKPIIFIGSGSSYFLSQSAEMIFKTELGACASSMAAGDIMVNYESYRNMFAGSTIVTISRSGSTTEIINAINAIKKGANSPIIGITCVENSDLTKIADLTLDMPWAFDESVCQTRTISNLYAAVALIAGILAENAGILESMERAVSTGNQFFGKYEGALKAIGYENWARAVVLADGKITGIATEAALAYKEISCMPSNYYHLLDARHGPMVLFDKDTLIIAAISNGDLSYQSAFIQDCIDKGCKVVVCKNSSIKDFRDVRLNITYEAVLDDISVGIPFLNVSQLISYYKAEQKGLDPDKPAGLDAWIKLV